MRPLSLAKVDVKLALRDGGAIFWIFIAPFIWVFFFSAINQSPDPSKSRVSLGVLNDDPSPLARRLIEGLTSENFAVTEIVPGAPGDDPPARTLTIPAGFSDAVAARRKVELELRETKDADPQATLAARVALHRVIVRLLATEAFGAMDPAEDSITVKSSWGGGKVIPSGREQTIPGNLVMFVLIASQTYGSALLARERKNGILRRLLGSPLARWEVILGKMLGRAAIACVQVGVFVLIGLAIFRIHWGDSPLGLALVLVSLVLCAASLGLLGGALFKTPDAAAGISIVIVMVMSALGGCWWPAEVMPPWLRTAGHAFPTAWAMDGLHQLIAWGGGLSDVILPSLVLLAFAAAAFTLAAWRLSATTGA